jgi:hypothetical protein
MTALVAALVLAVGLSAYLIGAVDAAAPAVAAGSHPLPEATKKKTPKPTASPTPTPSSTPTPTTRSAADAEGERWVQLAVIAGGGLLGSVLVFFLLGWVLRRRPRRRPRR